MTIELMTGNRFGFSEPRPSGSDLVGLDLDDLPAWWFSGLAEAALRHAPFILAG
jgi:hypothetical protein